MATCKECLHIEVCEGYYPTDMDKDIFHYCREGRGDEIPDIEKRCSSFKDCSRFVEVVRCKDCKHYHTELGWCDINSTFIKEHSEWRMFNDDDFCSYGERREGE